MGRLSVRVACAVSFVIGLFFIAVWAPHPWGWAGFDQYYDLGRQLARGEAFPTTDVPWGYAYYLAFFYRVFGDRPLIPLVVQAGLNALMPLLVYRVAEDAFDERVAAVAALLTGFLSFNTVYASTQSSDAVCSVLFMAGVLLFVRARRTDEARWYAAAGVVFGLAPQFRPNLILIPALLAAFVLVERRAAARAVAHAALLCAASALMLAPWIARTYWLTGEFLPTSTHAGVQLWYGTLQTGPYLKSRAHNPRSVFELGSFPYTSLDRMPLVVDVTLAPCAGRPERIGIAYWTDRDATRRIVAADRVAPDRFAASLPPSPAPTVYYYYVDGVTPSQADAPDVFFVSDDHLGDIDSHGDMLDVFDVIRLMRHAAWNEPVQRFRGHDLDVLAAAHALLDAAKPAVDGGWPSRFTASDVRATLTFDDGSTIDVPKDWTGRITDVGVSGAAAAAVLRTSVPFSRLGAGHDEGGCEPVSVLTVNAPYYRDQPHAMRRYTALAFDNIRRDPAAYVASVAYRTVRVFFIEGTDDPHTTHQFEGSGRVYRAATAVSIALLALAIAGVWLGWRRGAAIALPLVLIAYIPATLSFVLTNMRYSITVQPLLFMFVAVTIVSVLPRGPFPAKAQETAAPRRAGTQTARPL